MIRVTKNVGERVVNRQELHAAAGPPKGSVPRVGHSLFPLDREKLLVILRAPVRHLVVRLVHITLVLDSPPSFVSSRPQRANKTVGQQLHSQSMPRSPAQGP